MTMTTPPVAKSKRTYFAVMYWYTTAHDRLVGRVKNGSSRSYGASAWEVGEKRIKQQFTSTAALPSDGYEILHIEDLSAECETGVKNTSLELLRQYEQGYLHKEQKEAGMHVFYKYPKSEWFEDPDKKSVDYVVDFGMSLINARRHGSTRPNSYSLRNEQVECRDQAVAHFKAGGKKFLMNAKMRFGKTLTSYQIAKSIDAKRVLVLTYKPQAEYGWASDLKNHVDFAGWEYFYAKDFDKDTKVELPGVATTEVLFASFQDLNGMGKSKWENIKHYDFDLLVIDEQHYGSDSELAQQTLKALSFKHKLEVSGTPLHALMSGKFLDEEVYSWSYADEQRHRLAEKNTGWKTDVYRWLPTMEFMVFDLGDTAQSQSVLYTEDEGFTMQKMFGSDDGKTFNDQSAVLRWLNRAYTQTCHKKNSAMGLYYSQHMVWKMPSVNSCNAMKTLLESTEFVTHTPIVVSGTDGANLAGVKHHIKNGNDTGTVTLTCGSLMTGTTVPEWDMIFMLDGGVSAQEYFQTIFRVQSSNKKAGKEKCYVVDYNPQRTLQMIYEYARVLAKTTDSDNNNPHNVIADFLDFAPVINHSGDTPVHLNVEDIIDAVSYSSNFNEIFGSSTMFYFDNDSADVYAALDAVDRETKSGREVTVNNNGIDTGKNKTPTDKDTPAAPAPVDFTAKAKRELQQKAITMLRLLPNYLWIADDKPESIQDILNNHDAELFDETVGIAIADLKILHDCNYLNTARIDHCIMSYQAVQRTHLCELD